jgi:hypothetical protein
MVQNILALVQIVRHTLDVVVMVLDCPIVALGHDFLVPERLVAKLEDDLLEIIGGLVFQSIEMHYIIKHALTTIIIFNVSLFIDMNRFPRHLVHLTLKEQSVFERFFNIRQFSFLRRVFIFSSKVDNLVFQFF